MNTCHFTIAIHDARTDMPGLEDRLFTAGCDDALVCSHNQKVYLEFDREADSAETAIRSALDNIRAAGFNDPVIQEAVVSTLAEVAPSARV